MDQQGIYRGGVRMIPTEFFMGRNHEYAYPTDKYTKEEGSDLFYFSISVSNRAHARGVFHA